MVDVSVVIAAKNEAVHVREAVESILAQQGVDFELVFVDDGSTDETASIVRSMDHSRLHLLTNTKSGKVTASHRRRVTGSASSQAMTSCPQARLPSAGER